MRGYTRFSTVGQMAVGLGVFVLVAVVLDSGGLYRWGQRLDLGPERTVAMPVVSALHDGMQHLGLERVRQAELAGLARVRWSDDPAAEDEAVESASVAAAPVGSKAQVQVQGAGLSSAVSDVSAAMQPMAGNVPPTPKLALRPMVGDPPIANALPAITAVPVGTVRTVALVGDSMMAVGLSSTLLREAPRYKDLTLVKVFKSGTGLARPEVFDWQEEYPAMLQSALPNGAKPDVILVAIGANDGQGFVEDGVTYPFGTDGWKRIYERRVEAFLNMLEASGAEVLWVGLPPMKSASYNQKIALVNRIDYAVVKASPQAMWFSSAGVVGDADGQFEDYGEVHGATVRLRQSDGIHMSDDGADLLTQKLLPWLAKQGPVEAPAVKETAALVP